MLIRGEAVEPRTWAPQYARCKSTGGRSWDGLRLPRCRYREVASVEITGKTPDVKFCPVSFGEPDLGLLAFFQITTVKRRYRRSGRWWHRDAGNVRKPTYHSPTVTAANARVPRLPKFPVTSRLRGVILRSPFSGVGGRPQHRRCVRSLAAGFRHKAAPAKSGRMNAFELRQQDHAFLLVGIGASDDGRNRLRLAGVVRKVRDIGWNVEEIAWLNH